MTPDLPREITTRSYALYNDVFTEVVQVVLPDLGAGWSTTRSRHTTKPLPLPNLQPVAKSAGGLSMKSAKPMHTFQVKVTRWETVQSTYLVNVEATTGIKASAKVRK